MSTIVQGGGQPSLATRPSVLHGVQWQRSTTSSIQGEVDGHDRRLVCDVTTITANGTPTSTGEAFLRAEHSHPLPGTPTTCLQAFEEPRQPRVGLFYFQ